MAVKHVIRHNLGLDLARKATRHALESYRKALPDYDPRGRWVTNDRAEVQFTVLGKTLTGSVDVRPSEVALHLEVPFLFRAFQGVAMKVVEQEIQTWLDKAKAGDLDDEPD